jgi:hypothetical protein
VHASAEARVHVLAGKWKREGGKGIPPESVAGVRGAPNAYMRVAWDAPVCGNHAPPREREFPAEVW